VEWDDDEDVASKGPIFGEEDGGNGEDEEEEEEEEEEGGGGGRHASSLFLFPNKSSNPFFSLPPDPTVLDIEYL
jgi:hypothetical protein